MKKLLALPLVFFATTGFSDFNPNPLIASYYATGKITANGEAFNPQGLTAAHRRFPFGTMLRVTNVSNGLEVVVRINDRGPYIDGRSLDLTIGAAEKIGMIEDGLAQVTYSVIR
jgi:rare lipoprotein A